MRCSALLVAAALEACDGGCREVYRRTVTDPDEPLSIVRTLADMQAELGGSRSGPLHWTEEGPRVAKGFPAGGEAEITVIISVPNNALDVLLNESGPFPRRGTCPSHADVDLEIDLRSSDGLLDTGTVSQVSFHDVDDAPTIWVDVTDEDLGALTWDPLVEGSRLYFVMESDESAYDSGSLRARIDGEAVIVATWTLPKYHRARR
jgi:hypothetical protein